MNYKSTHTSDYKLAGSIPVFLDRSVDFNLTKCYQWKLVPYSFSIATLYNSHLYFKMIFGDEEFHLPSTVRMLS